MSVRSMVKALVPELVLKVLRDHREFVEARDTYGTVHGLRAWLAEAVSMVRPRRRVLFYPELPRSPHVAFKLCALLGCLVTDDPRNHFDVAFKRQGATLFEATRLSAVPVPIDRIVNGRSMDISKTMVGQRFEETFGYPLAVDPTAHVGPMVEKSDQNATHDGRIIEGPIPAALVQSDHVYQRVIDNRADVEGLVIDHRVPVHGTRIPLVYVKHRPENARFGNANASVRLAAPEDVFDADEIDRLFAFAAAMGIDYGEFDVLRDRDGRIYVVDANNTPAGPPNGLSVEDSRTAVQTLARSFDTFLGEWRA